MKHKTQSEMLVEPESQMQAVFNCLAELNREPIETLPPEEARRLPTLADAVREVLWQEGRTLSPEPVGAVEDVEVPGPHGPISLRIYWPLGSTAPSSTWTATQTSCPLTTPTLFFIGAWPWA